MTDAVIWIHLAATLFLTGLIWAVQVVHYPLLDHGRGSGFAELHRRHTRRIGFVVIPPMLAELASASWLVARTPAGVHAGLTWVGFALLGIVWLSTFALQVPEHKRLSGGFDSSAHRRLVCGNWVRTIAWSLRAAVALAIASSTTG